MKRRDILRLLPVSLTASLSAGRSFASENLRDNLAPHEPYSIQYINAIRDHFTRIRSNQAENLMEGAYAIARTIQKGGACWHVFDAGHTNCDIYPERNGLPAIFNERFEFSKIRDGDLVLARPGSVSVVENLARKDIFIIGAPSPVTGDALKAELLLNNVRKVQLWPHADIWIDTKIDALDGWVRIPGMPSGFAPATGADGPLIMWMLTADACRILAREGKSLPVTGDEPKIESNKTPGYSGWVNLNNPLMDDYYYEVMNQMELIGAELGTIREIASMALDSHLSGGRIYIYSRFSSLAGDANRRRSGLSILRGITMRNGRLVDGQKNTEFTEGTSRDCVIMGVLKPDDPVDLKNLELFRKRKMKIASLGPMTRNLFVPDGRTVPKETDIHAGRMCDTYGIFAVPGFEQRICPTSGILLNQMFWALVMEIVEQHITRTGGDIPASYLSGALKRGRDPWYNLDQTGW